MLPTPVSEYDRQRTGPRFTVRSANSPSYSLTRRPGVRKPRGFSVEERDSTEEVGKRERYTGTDGTNKEEDHTVAGYQARTGSRSSVKGQCEERETSGHKMSTKLNQNGTADKTITEFGRSGNFNPACESRGRTDWRRYNLPSRSKSLDWRTGTSSPDRGKMADMLSSKRGLDERVTGVEGMRGKVVSSVQAYMSAGTINIVGERSPVSHMSQTLDRSSRGHSLPTRLRSLSGPGSSVRGTATSLGPKGGQSIMERIEKLYGSAGFCKTEDYSKVRNFSTSGGTFPRRFSSGERSSLSPVQSRKSFTWTQKDTSETSLSPGKSKTRERLSGVQLQGQIQGGYSEEGEVNWGRGFGEMGTRSLDRTRSRYCVAAQIRSARARAGITAPPHINTFSEGERSLSLRDLSGLRERRVSGGQDQDGVKGKTNGTNGTLRESTGLLGAKETELKSSSTDEDVFESNPQKITLKTIERKRFPERSPATSAASVRNKINQFEALSQRAQGLTTGQVLMPRRAFSVPTQLSRAHDGVKKSGSAKALGGLRYKWEGLKVGGEAGDEAEEKATGAGKERKGKLGSERSLSVDEVGQRLGRKENKGNDLVENEGKERDSSNNGAEDFDKYSRLKSTLELPLNGGAQRQLRNFYIDETDFSKISSPEEASDRPPSLLLSDSSDTCVGVQETASPRVTSPVSDGDNTPTNSPNHSPFLSPTTQLENPIPIADSENECPSILTKAAKQEQDSPPLPHPLATSSHSNLPNLISPDVNTAHPHGKKQVLDLDAWVAGLNPKIYVWNDDEDDCEDDDDTQRDEDSNYDSDSGESSVTITSNMSQSDHRSFCVRWVILISIHFCFYGSIQFINPQDAVVFQTCVTLLELTMSRRQTAMSGTLQAIGLPR